MVVRRVTGGAADATAFDFTFALSLAGGPHRLRFSHGAIVQDPHAIGSRDSLRRQTALSYTYSRDAHRVGIEAELFDRRPDGAPDTEAWKVGLIRSYSFDRPPRRDGAPVAAARPARGRAAAPALLDLAPGTPLAEVRARLRRGRIEAPVERPGLLVYETRLYDAIERRQRLAMVHDGGRLEQATLVVDFTVTGDRDSVRQTFERVRRILVRRYGPPDVRIEEGAFTASLAADLARRRFRRLMEWEIGAGLLRFGIPRREDGRVRIEVTHARRLPPVDVDEWSLFEVR